MSVVGTRAQADQAFDLIIAWWLALGVPLSWAKGVMTCGSVPHRWIGIVYHLTPEGAIMRLPEDFVKDLLALIEPACSTTGALPVGDVEIMIGKAARVAHVVPAARPFVAGLWGGLAAAKQAKGLGDLSRVPCRRLCHSASWIRALLTEAESCPLRLERLVRPFPPAAEHDLSGHSIEFDASIYGGGALLRDPNGAIVEYFSTIWIGDEAPHLGVVIDDSSHQTFWEFATLLLALCVWGDRFTDTPVAVLGDNTGALDNALSLKGRGSMLAVARELSWRQARRRWRFVVGHLPSEHNQVADALSRAADPKVCAWPSLALASAVYIRPPKLRDLWLAAPS